MANGLYFRATMYREHTRYTYPWNYGDQESGWNLQIGVPEPLRWAFGDSLRPGYVNGVPGHDDPDVLFPSQPPWTTSAPNFLLDPANPFFEASALTWEFFPPPAGYKWADITYPIPYELHWIGDFEFHLWGYGTYDRYNYNGHGTYEVLHYLPLIRTGDPIGKKGLAPIVGSLALISFFMLQGSSAAARRRRK